MSTVRLLPMAAPAAAGLASAGGGLTAAVLAGLGLLVTLLLARTVIHRRGGDERTAS